MAKRTVAWTRTADLQFVGVLDYWFKRNKSNSYSKKLVGLVTDKTEQIANNPFIYKLTDFKDVRIASMGNYSLYFKITETHIIVFAFWDNRQDPKKLINILKEGL